MNVPPLITRCRPSRSFLTLRVSACKEDFHRYGRVSVFSKVPPLMVITLSAWLT